MRQKLLIALSISVICVFLAVPIRASVYADKVLALSPIAYWKLDETTGTTAYDSSGNSFNGTYYGATLNQIAGAGSSMGNAPSFDGINDYVELYSTGLRDLINWDHFSLIAWIKVSNAGDWDSSSYRMPVTLIGTGTGQAQFYKNNAANQFGIAPGSVFSFTESGWFLAAVTYDKENNHNYGYTGINGSITTQINTTAAGLTGTLTYAKLSSYGNPINFYWKGAIAHVALFPTALSYASIEDLANSSPPPTPTPTSTPVPSPSPTPRSPQLILTLANGNQFEIDYSITAGDIAQFIPGLLLIAFLVFLIILKLVRR